MFSNYKISEENTLYFNSLCKEMSKGSNVFDMIYGQVLDEEIRKEFEKPHIELNTKEEANAIDNFEKNDQMNQSETVFELQKKFLATNSSHESLMKSVALFDSKSFMRDANLIVEDHSFQEWLERVQNMEDSSVFIFAKLILLPKLLSNNGSVSDAVGNLLKKLFSKHEDKIANEVLVPLVSSEGQNDYGISHLLQYLITKETSSHTLVKLIRALSEKPGLEEKDLNTLGLVFECMETTNLNSQKAVIEFLNKYSNHFGKSIKFGRCILGVIQKMGKFISDRNSLAFLLASHKSSIRKTIEIHLNKIDQ